MQVRRAVSPVAQDEQGRQDFDHIENPTENALFCPGQIGIQDAAKDYEAGPRPVNHIDGKVILVEHLEPFTESDAAQDGEEVLLETAEEFLAHIVISGS